MYSAGYRIRDICVCIYACTPLDRRRLHPFALILRMELKRNKKRERERREKECEEGKERKREKEKERERNTWSFWHV